MHNTIRKFLRKFLILKTCLFLFQQISASTCLVNSFIFFRGILDLKNFRKRLKLKHDE